MACRSDGRSCDLDASSGGARGDFDHGSRLTTSGGRSWTRARGCGRGSWHHVVLAWAGRSDRQSPRISGFADNQPDRAAAAVVGPGTGAHAVDRRFGFRIPAGLDARLDAAVRGYDDGLAGPRSLALIHRCLLSEPRTRPNHSRRGRRSFTHQSSWPATTMSRSLPGLGDQPHAGLHRCTGSDPHP